MSLKPPLEDTAGFTTLSSLDSTKADKTSLAFNPRNYMTYADPCQQAVNACSAFGGGEVEIPAGQWVRPAGTPLSIPNFVTVRGHGQSTIIRANGNHYAISFNPGNRSRVSNLMIESVTTQSSGGGIDWTNAGSNTWVDHIYFSSGLFTSINLAPSTSTAVHMLSDLRWNGGSSYNTGFKIGNGTNLITDVSIRQVKGTAATNADMQQWWDIARNVDTLTIEDCLTIKGQNGMLLGSRGASGNVTGMEVDKLILDSMVNIAIDSVNTLDVTFGSDCMIQTCGTASAPGIRFGAGTTLFRYSGTIRQCGGDGVLIQNGSRWVRLVGAEIYDNNSTNTANLSGVSIAANADLWEVNSCLIGNGILAGHQKYGVNIAAGDSNLWKIINNDFYRNETLPLNDNSTGALTRIGGNYAVNGAGLALDLVNDVNYGNQTIRDSSGTDRLIHNSTGWTRWINTFAANPVIEVRGTSGQTAQIAKFQRDTTLKSQVNSQGEFVLDDATKGLVLKDTQGTPHYWRVTVSNVGALVITDAGTTRPD